MLVKGELGEVVKAWPFVLTMLILLVVGCTTVNDGNRDSSTAAPLPTPALQPPVVNCSSDGDSERLNAAWHNEFNILLNYSTYLEKRLQEAERGQYLCSGFTYPRCPANWVKLSLECTGSMKPNFDCQDEIKAFNPESYPFYGVGVCDVVSFDVPKSYAVVVNDALGRSLFIDRFTHRIIGQNGSRFIVKGDANILADAYQPTKQDLRWIICR